MMNFFNSNSPTSLFTQRRLCTISTPDARIILNFSSETAYREALEEYLELNYRLRPCANLPVRSDPDDRYRMKAA